MNSQTFNNVFIPKLNFPDDVWNNIKSFLPRPVSKTAVILKNSIIIDWIDRLPVLKDRPHKKMELLNKRNIMPDYTREKRRKKIGLKSHFEKSQKDYYKRKGIKNGKIVEYVEKRTFWEMVRKYYRVRLLYDTYDTRLDFCMIPFN